MYGDPQSNGMAHGEPLRCHAHHFGGFQAIFDYVEHSTTMTRMLLLLNKRRRMAPRQQKLQLSKELSHFLVFSFSLSCNTVAAVNTNAMLLLFDSPKESHRVGHRHTPAQFRQCSMARASWERRQEPPRLSPADAKSWSASESPHSCG